jgi:hypothetical protein
MHGGLRRGLWQQRLGNHRQGMGQGYLLQECMLEEGQHPCPPIYFLPSLNIQLPTSWPPILPIPPTPPQPPPPPSSFLPTTHDSPLHTLPLPRFYPPPLRTHTCTHAHTHMHTRACAHAHTHARTHTHTCLSSSAAVMSSRMLSSDRHLHSAATVQCCRASASSASAYLQVVPHVHIGCVTRTYWLCHTYILVVTRTYWLCHTHILVASHVHIGCVTRTYWLCYAYILVVSRVHIGCVTRTYWLCHTYILVVSHVHIGCVTRTYWVQHVYTHLGCCKNRADWEMHSKSIVMERWSDGGMRGGE